MTGNGLEERNGLGMGLVTDSRSSGSLSESWRMEEWAEVEVWSWSDERWTGLEERRERPSAVGSVDENENNLLMI